MPRSRACCPRRFRKSPKKWPRPVSNLRRHARLRLGARVGRGKPATSEDRTRDALYEAIGRAYDFSLAAAEATGRGFAELLADAGLSTQDRAPMTPVVKLVFGADYDKTRLTEYAAALGPRASPEPPRKASSPSILRRPTAASRAWSRPNARLRREESRQARRGGRRRPAHGLARKLRALARARVRRDRRRRAASSRSS